jgi:23S rRNA pseudouridine1911/1915/1917 synthase
MKITSSDLLAILRRFAIADDSHVPRYIEQVKQSNPQSINQLVSFRFQKRHYFVLLDETAEDSASYVIDQIKTMKPDAAGTLLVNPTTDIMTYGLPFKGKDVYLFKQDDGKVRLDTLLAERYADVSRSTWQKHIKAGHVTVNGTPILKPKADISPDDDVAVSVPDAIDHSELELPILYIDDNVIVVNKPVGVLTHSKGALNDEFTVADFFRRYTTVALDTTRPGIVHRLDRDTSGVIIGARNEQAFDLLKKQFADRKAKKQYLAITDGIPKESTATINVPIGRNPSAPSTFRADANGKPAMTDYDILSVSDDHALLRLHPHTGRTHQLRVHLAHIGTPITGDRVYGKPSDRLYLHAHRLEVTTAPEQRQTFYAPVPAQFTSMFPDLAHYATDA